eukprot:scaffold187034_cov36-Prasinocladus_malaysianus.AAC.2
MAGGRRSLSAGASAAAYPCCPRQSATDISTARCAWGTVFVFLSRTEYSYFYHGATTLSYLSYSYEYQAIARVCFRQFYRTRICPYDLYALFVPVLTHVPVPLRAGTRARERSYGHRTRSTTRTSSGKT